MNVLFLIEAGGRYGLGHLMRSAVLMKALTARGIHSEIALRVGGGSVPGWALPDGRLYMIDDNDSAVAQAESLAGECNPRWAVVDGYDFLAGNAVKQIKLLGVRVLAFDDLGIEGGGANIVVNQNREDAAGDSACWGLSMRWSTPRTRLSASQGCSVSGEVLVRSGSDLQGMTDRVVSALTRSGQLKVISSSDRIIAPRIRVDWKPSAHLS